jgi:adenylate cyclase
VTDASRLGLDAAELERFGLADTSLPAARDTLELVRFVLERGASHDEVVDALETGTLGPLALELTLCRDGEARPFRDAIAHAGGEPDSAAVFWQLLGFGDPVASRVRLYEGEARTLQLLSGAGRDLLGEEAITQLARVIGGSLAAIGEAVVDSFRIRVETPQLSAGVAYSDVVRDFSDAAATVFPALREAIDVILRRHVISVARGLWAVDDEQTAVTRERAVGFADLVGYTERTRSLAPGRLAAALERFGALVAQAVGRHGARLVKLIGDEAMFVAAEPRAAAAVALDLVEQFEADPELPPIRVGVACGPVVALHGDYYGDVVNLAARLVQAAQPSEVLTSETVASQLRDTFQVDSLPRRELKGFEPDVATYRLAGPSHG